MSCFLTALVERLQTDDLARMHRLFNRIPKGLEPVAEMFKKHVEGEGMALVKEVTEAAQSKKEKGRREAGQGRRRRQPRAALRQEGHPAARQVHGGNDPLLPPPLLPLLPNCLGIRVYVLTLIPNPKSSP